MEVCAIFDNEHGSHLSEITEHGYGLFAISIVLFFLVTLAMARYAGSIPAENRDPGTEILLELFFSGSVVCVLLSGIYAAFEFIEWLAVSLTRLGDRCFGSWINNKQETLATKGISAFGKTCRIDTRDFWTRELSSVDIIVDLIVVALLLIILEACLWTVGLGGLGGILGLAQFIALMLVYLTLVGAWRYAKRKFQTAPSIKQEP